MPPSVVGPSTSFGCAPLCAQDDSGVVVCGERVSGLLVVPSHSARRSAHAAYGSLGFVVDRADDDRSVQFLAFQSQRVRQLLAFVRDFVGVGDLFSVRSLFIGH